MLERSVHHWQGERLTAKLRPLAEVLLADSGSGAALSEIALRYCKFYGIDKENLIDGVDHRMGYFEAQGFRLATHFYNVINSKGTVFIFHGYFDHAGLYGHLIEYLLRSGFSVLIYDLPGHGLSSGESVAINHFAQYRSVLEKCLTICKGRVAEPWFAAGQSTGAAVLVEYLFRNRFHQNNTPFKHWVLLAPLLRPSGWKNLAYLHSVLRLFLKTWKRDFLPNSHDSKFVSFLKDKDPMQVGAISVKWVGALRRWISDVESSEPITDVPVTIIQGPDDETVDWRHNIPHLKQMLPNADVKVLVKGRHQLVNESPDIRNKVFKQLVNGIES